MKDKKIFKKWWFWAIVAIVVLSTIGALTENDTTPQPTTTNTEQTPASTSTATLPKINADDYKNQEGLVVYKELKAKGYTVSAEFDKQALTDINGKASEVFEPLDPNKTDDKLSVDAFVVGSLTQDGDSIKLIITNSAAR